MKIHKSFKTELKPNKDQIHLFQQYAGTSRFAYNWGLRLCEESYEMEKELLEIFKEANDPNEEELKEYKTHLKTILFRPNAIDLFKEITNLKNNSPDYEWLKDISKWVPQMALRNLETSFKRFFKGESKFPRYKKRGRNDSFQLEVLDVSEKEVKIAKLGTIKLKEKDYIPQGKVKNKTCTISKKAGRWFISIMFEIEVEKRTYNDDIIGVDLGIKSLAVTSDGEEFKGSKKLYHLEEKLKRTQKKLSRQVKGSNSYQKTLVKLQKLWFNITNQRKDILHKVTTYLARTTLEGVIALEDLNISGMIKNHKLAKAISNMGLYEFRRMIEYKVKWYGKIVHFIDPFFPSSKMCSDCGAVREDLKLSDRSYNCDCGFIIDRDLNAAINIRNSARYARINAGGEERFISSERCSSVKPEEKEILIIRFL